MASVVAIGVFDGVHLGHQALVNETLRIAKSSNLQSVALTFSPHPMSVVRGLQVDCLTSLDRKIELLTGLGIQKVHVCEFTQSLANLSPKDFIDQILLNQLDAKEVVIGAGFRFGKSAQGTSSDFLAAGLEVTEVGHVDFENERVSSTRIRKSLAQGNLQLATSLLSRSHRVEGEVIYGQQRGRELGFPTANIAPSFRQAIPVDGVYAGWMTRLDTQEKWMAAISIGTNPTFTDIETRSIEAYALDATDINLYGVRVAVDFSEFLRPMWAFKSLEELVDAIGQDVQNTRKALSK